MRDILLLSSLTDDFLAILPNRESLLTLFPSEFLAPLSSNSALDIYVAKSEAKPLKGVIAVEVIIVSLLSLVES